MVPGFVILAHDALHRVAQLARHLADAGAPVVVHVDRRVSPAARAALQEGAGSDVTVIATWAPEWGRFSLVAATLDAVEELLARAPEVGHVCLLSGACLPIRPLEDLTAYLAAHPDRDFIESVPVVAGHDWVEDGLSGERFTLYHPFSHRHQRWLFSRSVDLQRTLGVSRRLPPGLQAHLGMQWWCLSGRTLQAILAHEDRALWERFFRLSWIPDEGFFQTLVRRVRPQQEPGPPLHLKRFNPRGRPIVFHDDHLDLLRAADHFFARKVDPDAGALYEHFLGPSYVPFRTGFRGDIDDAPFRQARAEISGEGRGLVGPSRYPLGTTPTRCDTARSYLVIISADASLLADLHPRLQAAAPGRVVHGALFRQDRPAAFACGSLVYKGNLSGLPVLRDYRVAQFLSRLVWLDRDEGMVFLLSPEDTHEIRHQLISDPNARLVFLGSDQAAYDCLTMLKRPFHEGPKANPIAQQSWHRALDPAPVGAVPKPGASGLDISALTGILGSDWADPTGWQVPG